MARQALQTKLSQADELLQGMDAFVLEQLGLKLPKEEKRSVFSVKFGDIKNRFDADYHSPYFRDLRSMLRESKFKVVKLSEILQRSLTSGFVAGRGDSSRRR